LNSDPSVVQPVASRYTDYAILAPERKSKQKNSNMITKRIRQRSRRRKEELKKKRSMYKNEGEETI
jgi:hypothetical protein